MFFQPLLRMNKHRKNVNNSFHDIASLYIIMVYVNIFLYPKLKEKFSDVQRTITLELNKKQ